MRQQWKITTSNIIFGVIIKFYVVFLEMVLVMVITVLSASLHLCTTHCHIRLSSGVHNTARPSCGCPHDLPNPHHCYRAGAHSHEQQARFLWDSVLKKKKQKKQKQNPAKKNVAKNNLYNILILKGGWKITPGHILSKLETLILSIILRIFLIFWRFWYSWFL